MTKYVAVGNFRGGIGKTTSTVNLAYTFARMGKKVLVIDSDPQNNATPFFTNVKKNGKSIAEALKVPEKVEDYIEPSKYENIDILKGDTSLMGEELKTEELGWLVKAKEVLDSRYDICMIDTNPNLSSLTVSVLVGADLLLTPIGLNESSRDNLALLQEKIEPLTDRGLVWKVFAMKVDLNRKAQKKSLDDIVNKHSYPFMEHYISSAADVDNAWSYYKPVEKHRSKSIVVDEFYCLANEILEVLEIESEAEEWGR